LPKVIDCLDNFTQSSMVVPFIEHYVANREVPLLWPPLPEGTTPTERGWAGGGHLG
jgi:hypothetical protein